MTATKGKKMCDQCGDTLAEYANNERTHFICQDCSDLNLTNVLIRAEREGLIVFRDKDVPVEPVPFYVPRPEDD